MEIKGQENYQVQGKAHPLDVTLKESYISAIKQHIELLEERKGMFEQWFIYTQTPNFVKGIIQGLNYAIEQLYNDINQLQK